MKKKQNKGATPKKITRFTGETQIEINNKKILGMITQSLSK